MRVLPEQQPPPLLCSYWSVIPRLTIKWDLSLLWLSIKFGLPAIAGNIGFLIFQMNDRYMLNWLSTDIETGKYSFGFKIANFINLIFVSTIGMSFMPSIFSKEKEENNTRYYRKMLTYYCFLIAFVILGFLFFYKDLLAPVVKNKDYWDGLGSGTCFVSELYGYGNELFCRYRTIS